MNRRKAIDHANRRHPTHHLSDHNSRFANISKGAQRVWRLDIPLLFLDAPEPINLLLYDDRTGELHLLRVPTEYFRTKKTNLGDRPEKECIALQLAADEPRLFQNVRPRTVMLNSRTSRYGVVLWRAASGVHT